MKRFLYIVAVVTVIATAATSVQAQEMTGFRGDYLGQVAYVQKQILDLENAIPDAKMTWRPNNDVRSVSEVYLHIAYTNYMLPHAAGVALPQGMVLPEEKDAATWEKSTTDKNAIHDQLAKSFDFVRNAVSNMSDANLEKMVELFGMKMSVRSMLFITLDHMHEHLGQSIAYARMNNVVPPWTAAQMAAENAQKSTQGGSK